MEHICPNGPQLSRLIYGTWRLLDATDATTYSPASIKHRIQHCISLGITSFDLADIYGGGNHQVEEAFGKGLQLIEDRSKVQLISKCGIRLQNDACSVKHYDTSRTYLLTRVERTCALLNTHLDVLLLHRPDPFMDADEVAETMMELKKRGLVRYFGVSNFTPSQFDLLQSRVPFTLITNQVEFNVVRVDPLFDGTLDQCQVRFG